MTFQQTLMIIAAIAAVLAMAVLLRTARSLPSRAAVRSGGPLAIWLSTVAGALIIVGIVSHTLLRHVVQIAPLVIALPLLLRRTAWGSSAAAVLLAFWLLIMGAIWLFLLGIARIFSGRFTPTEIALTVVIGCASVIGLITAYRQGTTLSVPARFGTIILFALLQFAAMLLSVQPFVANR